MPYFLAAYTHVNLLKSLYPLGRQRFTCTQFYYSSDTMAAHDWLLIILSPARHRQQFILPPLWSHEVGAGVSDKDPRDSNCVGNSSFNGKRPALSVIWCVMSDSSWQEDVHAVPRMGHSSGGLCWLSHPCHRARQDLPHPLPTGNSLSSAQAQPAVPGNFGGDGETPFTFFIFQTQCVTGRCNPCCKRSWEQLWQYKYTDPEFL